MDYSYIPKHLTRTTFLTLSTALILSACGGSQTSSTTQTSDQAEDLLTNNEPLVGTFVDSAVSGLSYLTDTQAGITNEAGEFLFYPGETITFSVGSVDLPSAPASEEMTPLDLSDTKSLDSTVVVNILQFLQTLDNDQNPDNGIQLEEAAALITNATVDFNDENFSDQSAVQQIVSEAPANTNNRLVDVDSALEHFGSSLILQADPPAHANTYSKDSGTEFFIVFKENDSYNGDMIAFSRKHFALTVNGELSDGKHDTSSNVWHLWNFQQRQHQFVLVTEQADGSLETCWASSPEKAVACNEDATVAYLFSSELDAQAFNAMDAETITEQSTDPVIIAAAQPVSPTAERETVSLAAAQAESIDAAEIAVQKTEDELLAEQMAIKAQEEQEAAELAALESTTAAKVAAEAAAAEEIARQVAAQREAEELEAARVAAEQEAAAKEAAKKAATELAAAQAAAEKEAELKAAEELAAQQAATAKAAAEQEAAKLAAAQAAADKEAAKIAAAKAAEEKALAEAKATAEREAAERAAAMAKVEEEAAAKAAAEKEAAIVAAAEAEAEAERIAAQIAADKAEADRLLAAEKAEADRIAAAEEERLAAEKAEADRIAAAEAEAERLAAEKAEADRIAAEKVEEERLAAEKAEADRLASENVDPSTVQCDAPLAELKAAMLLVVNNARKNDQFCGGVEAPAVGPLMWDDRLEQAATVHVNDMATYSLFSHTGSDGLNVRHRAVEAGYPGGAIGENIANGPLTVQRVHDGFMNSKGHCFGTMFSTHIHVGAACVFGEDPQPDGRIFYRSYWAVVFGGPY